MKRICTKCGQPIAEGDDFCEKCGTEYTADEALTVLMEDEEKTVFADADSEKTVLKDIESDAENDVEPFDSAEKTEAGKAFDGFLNSNKKKLIAVGTVIVLLIVSFFAIRTVTSNTPEAKLKKAVEYRLNGDIDNSAVLDYDSNFNKNYTKAESIEQMRQNPYLGKIESSNLTIKIRSSTRLIDEPILDSDTDQQKHDKQKFTNRVNQLAETYRDTDQITDIRVFTYDLLEKKEVKYSGSAEAIKVNGKWYILGVARDRMPALQPTE